MNDAGPFLSNKSPRSSRLSLSYDGEALERSGGELTAFPEDGSAGSEQVRTQETR